MPNPLLYFRNKNQRDDRREKAPALLMELVGKTNLDQGTINSIIKGYVDDGEVRLPGMQPEGFQGPLMGGQERETKANSLRPRLMTRNEETGVYDWAPEGVTDRSQLVEVGRRFAPKPDVPAWTFDENGQIVEIPGQRKAGYVAPLRRPAPGHGRGGVATVQERADLATISKLQQAQKESGAKGIPVSEELLKQGVEAAERLGLPTFDTVSEIDAPGFKAALQRFLPGGKRGKQIVRERGIGKAEAGDPVEFSSEDEVEKANLPKGTIVIINGRRAVIE